MADIITEIKSLNEKAKVLNNQRQQAMGAHKIAVENYQNAIKQYAEKYGVTLTESNFMQEYMNIQAQLEASVASLRQQISDIETGKYKEKVQFEEIKEEQEEPIVATPEKVVYTTPIIEEKPVSGVIENIVTQKKRGRPSKTKVEETVKVGESVKVTDEMPFDGGVPITENVGSINEPKVTIGVTIQPTPVEQLTPVIQPMSIEQPTPKVPPTTINNIVIGQSQSVQNESQSIHVGSSVTEGVQATPQGIVIGQPTTAGTVQNIKPIEPTVTVQPSIVIGQAAVVDDEDDSEDEEVPQLNWGNGGASLNDFKGFSL